MNKKDVKKKTVCVELTERQANTLLMLLANEMMRDGCEPGVMRRLSQIDKRLSDAMGVTWQ